MGNGGSSLLYEMILCGSSLVRSARAFCSASKKWQRSFCSRRFFGGKPGGVSLAFLLGASTSAPMNTNDSVNMNTAAARADLAKGALIQGAATKATAVTRRP